MVAECFQASWGSVGALLFELPSSLASSTSRQPAPANHPWRRAAVASRLQVLGTTTGQNSFLDRAGLHIYTLDARIGVPYRETTGYCLWLGVNGGRSFGRLMNKERPRSQALFEHVRKLEPGGGGGSDKRGLPPVFAGPVARNYREFISASDATAYATFFRGMVDAV